MKPTLIIGAGPAGLTAGFELWKQGIGSTILEADRVVGGISRTVCYRGYRFDIGGHRFFSKIPLVNEIWREILGEEFLRRPRMSRIHYGGKFFDYPLKAGNALLGLGPAEAFLGGMSYAKARCFPNRPEDTFERWVCNRFGRRLYEIFFRTYTEKVWGIPCSEISADWAAQRIKNLSLTEAVRTALLGGDKNRNGEVITTLIDGFNYPRLGPGMMWERCESILKDHGSEVLRGMQAERIVHDGRRVQHVEARTADGERVDFGAEHFVTSMPLRELIHKLDPLPPSEVVKAADHLRYRDFLTVVLVVKRENVFPDNWIYVHTPEVKMGRIQNYKNWSPHMVPDGSRTSLGLEYFLWDQDQLWSWPEEELIRLGIHETSRLGLVEPDEVEDGTVVRMRKAYPVYDQAYPKSLETVRNYLSTLENLQSIGRNGQHRYNNQDHSMMTGIYAARNIAGESNDIWAVNVEKDYHEEVRTPSAGAGDRMVPGRARRPATAAAGRRRAPTDEELDELINAAFAKLDPVALGGAVGIVAGVSLFVASALLLIRGGPVVGPMLSLLGHYLLGFKMSWPGAFIGLFEAAIGGFVVGMAIAVLHNWYLCAYAALVRRAAMWEQERDVLSKV